MKKSAGEVAKDVAKGLVISAAALLIGTIYVPIPRTAVTIAHIAVVYSNDGLSFGIITTQLMQTGIPKIRII